MRSREELDEALAAHQQRTALLSLHARALAHEISNIMFLSEIRAKQPESAAGEEISRALPLARRLARLLADALAPEPKQRVLGMSEALDELQSLVIKPSRGQVPACEVRYVSEGAREARFQEWPCSLLLIVQDLLSQVTVATPSNGKLVEVDVAVDEDETEIVLSIDASQQRLAKTGFIAHECARNGFAAAERNGSFRLMLPWLRDDET